VLRGSCGIGGLLCVPCLLRFFSSALGCACGCFHVTGWVGAVIAPHSSTYEVWLPDDYTKGRTPLTFVTFGRCLKPIRLHLPCFHSVLTSRVQSPTWPWFSKLCDLSALLYLINASREWRFYSCSSVSTSDCYGTCLWHVVTAFTLSLCSALCLRT
jgi:hypothetical protein